MRLVLPLLAIAALLAAGCVSTPDPIDPQSAADFVDPIIEQHDHTDPAAHALWTPNMEQLAFLSLGESPNETRGTYGEIDIQGDRAYVAVLGDAGEVPGFVIVDIADRDAPQALSFVPSPGTRVADVKGEPTNTYLFLGGERGAPNSQNRIVRTANDLANAVQAGAPEQFTTRNGIRVFDVSDPAAAREIAFAPSDSGCHMLFYKEYAGGEWVFCVGIGINVYSFDRAAGTIDLAARYAPSDPARVAGMVAADPAEAPTVLAFDTTPHDITVQDDAMSGKTLMYASYWDLGLRIVDVSDPSQPVELGAWVGDSAQRWAGNLHTAMAYETPDGRRLVYAIPELFTGEDVPAIFVLDATDLAAPTLVGEWAAAGEHPNDGIRFSLHNFQIVGGRLYLAYYHAGVWVLDVAGEKAVAPEILGYYLPHEAVKTYAEEADVPDTWDVVLKDGHIYAVDINTGLYVLHYAGDTLGDALLTSYA